MPYISYGISENCQLVGTAACQFVAEGEGLALCYLTADVAAGRESFPLAVCRHGETP
ncbi:hypothetical protein [Arthrobacter sp. TE12232]